MTSGTFAVVQPGPGRSIGFARCFVMFPREETPHDFCLPSRDRSVPILEEHMAQLVVKQGVDLLSLILLKLGSFVGAVSGVHCRYGCVVHRPIV